MMTTNHPSSNPSKSTSPIFTPLEQEILDEYSLLLDNLNNLSQELSTLSERPAGEILDGLRMLERKMSLVFTLLKASVYSIVLQQGIGDDNDDDGGGGGQEEEGRGKG